ncbi:solute carrier organic anion transporter family member 4C1-like isoform X2 [Actinia tenebrosa]|nr:solute carrier organic anion transporter family member 4C1-like isoform X2 [Actinia tenebrosa]XP_031572442.1 solute carrier organic anion transporter family member 4C1-like isoform X2 [Actinia tenebrosa]XP_031572443.1 solute carrier organic anion transporter family member 4C1-like isoform X2 [Actinia tenebrosa]
MVTNHKVRVSPSPPDEQDSNRLPSDVVVRLEDDDVRWGWLRFRPEILQSLLTPRWFLVFVSLFSIAQGMAINSFVSIAIPTLEKQFSFSSTQTGVIVSSNDVMGLLLVCFVSFRGDYGHKTKWLGYGALVTSIGCIMFALPNFLIERGDIAKKNEESFGLCGSNTTQHSYRNEEGCSADGTVGTSMYLMIFILSQLLSGAGTTPLHTLGTSYIDENVDPKYTSVYIGVFYATIMLGPGLGSIIGGNLLNFIYVDIKLPPNVYLKSKDPAWIGAWWLGPLACGGLLFVVGIILLGFPKQLANATRLRQQAIERGLIKKGENVSGNMKDILPVTKSLLTNGAFMYQNMALTVSALVGGGLGPFLFKIIRTRYGASPSIIGLSIALILIPGAGGGIALGSFLVKKFGAKDSCKSAAKMTFYLQLVGIWTAVIFLIPGCEYSNFAGIDKSYKNSNAINIKDSCNSNCNCSLSTYNPICGPDGLNYFSPCFAGCTKVTNLSYTRCSCLSSPSTVLKPGLCEQNCKNLIYFLVGAVILTIFSFSNAIPSKIVTLRSVPDNQRAYALGLQFVFLRSLGSLPGPIVFGRIIDTTCTMWQEKCGNDGNCRNYDHVTLSWILMGTAMPTYALSCVGYFLSWHYSKKQEKLQSNDVDLKNVEEKDGKEEAVQETRIKE